MTASGRSAPPPSVLRVADHTLDEMLVALRYAATNEAMGLEALEVLAAAESQPVFAAAVDDVRRQGIAIGAVHALLIALVPHQAAIATLLGGERS